MTPKKVSPSPYLYSFFIAVIASMILASAFLSSTTYLFLPSSIVLSLSGFMFNNGARYPDVLDVSEIKSGYASNKSSLASIPLKFN